MGGSRKEMVQYFSCRYCQSQEAEGLVHPLEIWQDKFIPFFLQMKLNKQVPAPPPPAK